MKLISSSNVETERKQCQSPRVSYRCKKDIPQSHSSQTKQATENNGELTIAERGFIVIPVVCRDTTDRSAITIQVATAGSIAKNYANGGVGGLPTRPRDEGMSRRGKRVPLLAAPATLILS